MYHRRLTLRRRAKLSYSTIQTTSHTMTRMKKRAVIWAKLLHMRIILRPPCSSSGDVTPGMGIHCDGFRAWLISEATPSAKTPQQTEKMATATGPSGRLVYGSVSTSSSPHRGQFGEQGADGAGVGGAGQGQGEQAGESAAQRGRA